MIAGWCAGLEEGGLRPARSFRIPTIGSPLPSSGERGNKAPAPTNHSAGCSITSSRRRDVTPRRRSRPGGRAPPDCAHRPCRAAGEVSFDCGKRQAQGACRLGRRQPAADQGRDTLLCLGQAHGRGRRQVLGPRVGQKLRIDDLHQRAMPAIAGQQLAAYSAASAVAGAR